VRSAADWKSEISNSKSEPSAKTPEMRMTSRGGRGDG
jgi:hypothetical protein